MNIRAATADDLETILRMEAAAFEVDKAGAAHLNRLLSDGSILVGEVAGQVVGCAALRFLRGKGIACLDLLVAVPSGKGYGAALLKAGEQEAVARGYRILRLDVRADDDRASRFYGREGFRGFPRLGRKPVYYSDGVRAHRLFKLVGRHLPRNGALGWIAFAVVGLLNRRV